MKRLSKLLALVLVFGMLAACGGGDTTTSAAPSAEPSAAPSQEVVEKRPNRLIYGSTTGISGDMAPSSWWTNNADDNSLRNLINDYTPVVTNQGGAYIENPTVTTGIESVTNADGTKTFTVGIQQGLKYNNGEPITAADYVAYALVQMSPATLAASATISAESVVGAPAYQAGEVNYISGLRLLDEYTYSITINADYVPYYYDITYASLQPLYLPQYASAALTVKDDGQGAYLDGGELVAEEIEAARWIYEGHVSAGPYQIVSIDTAAYEAVLEINPNYAGNFEGQKPSIKQIVMVKTVTETQFDALKTGSVDMLNSLSDGAEVNSALDLVEEGGYETINYERNGYGKLMFQCDFGPTQFEAVRHAVAYLLDRNEFANTFCQGFGAVVHGPYGLAMQMYKDSEELFANEINTYSYDPAKAVELLEADGWTLNADGTPYSGEGVRYKEVTPEQAGTYEKNVKLSDGRILMPLHIMWSSSEDNPVSELLAVMLMNGQQTKDAGMVIEQVIMSFDDLLNYMYRDESQGEKYGVPTYGMFNLATNFTPAYDQSYTYSDNPEHIAAGHNVNFIVDETLADSAWDMVYGVESGDYDKYLELWQTFILRWNELLPEVPLYSNVYYTVFPEWLDGFEQSSLWEFEQAVLYATIQNAE